MKSPFESQKEFTVPWIIVIMLFILTLTIGCDKYEEGDSKAKEAFEKMTVVERGMYDAVENAWNQGFLTNIRQAIAAREVKPLEEAIPFIDIANVIKSNNDITLKIEDNWQTDAKNKAISGRWDRLDAGWYIKIINKLGMKESDIKKQDFVKEEVIPDKPNVEITVTSSSNDDSSDESVKKEEEYFETKDDIILLQEYDNLYFELKDCQPAIDKYSQIIEERLITIEDRDLLLKMATKCKAITIKEKLKLWKTTK